MKDQSGRRKRKRTGGLRRPSSNKKRHELGREPAETTVGEPRFRVIDSRGTNEKTRALSTDVAQVATGGETVDRDNLQVVVSDASCGTGDPNHRYRPALLGVASTELMAGSTVHVDDRLCASGPLDLSDATVSVVWVASDGGAGRRLLVWEGPRA